MTVVGGMDKDICRIKSKDSKEKMERGRHRIETRMVHVVGRWREGSGAEVETFVRLK